MSCKITEKICIVCETKNCRFRCPKCVNYYCGKNCFKQHECKAIEKCEENLGIENNLKENLILDETDLIVPRRKLELLKNSVNIKKNLESKRLRDKIKSIDGSRLRLKLLNQEMKENKHFNDFIMDVLKEMKFVNEDGVFCSELVQKT